MINEKSKMHTNITIGTDSNEFAGLDLYDLANEYKKYNTNLYSKEFKIITLDILTIINYIEEKLSVYGKPLIISYDYYRYIIKININGYNCLILLVNNSYRDIRINITVSSTLKNINIIENIIADFNVNKKPVIEWHYSTNRGIQSKSVSFENSTIAKDIYYPYIKKPIFEYMDEYKNSTATVLVLIGEPGTGKTSFIRNYIERHNEDVIITYDENVMSQDSFLIDFMTDDEKSLMIVEDADVLIRSRQRDDNKIMSKLLNISDGLIKIPNKKIIFSTNLQDPDEIDHALVRSGRCFDLIKFRQLTKVEAQKVADDAGIELPDLKDDYTLADIFNGRNIVEKKKFGFV